MFDHTTESVGCGNSYTQDPQELTKDIEVCFLHKDGPGKLPKENEDNSQIYGIVVPHDLLKKSGPVAAHSYFKISNLTDINTIIIIGPDQKETSREISVYTRGILKTPFGEVEVDEDVAKKIISLNEVEENNSSHVDAEAIEIQIPFLQYSLRKPFRIVPIIIPSYEIKSSIKLGRTLAQILKEQKILVVAVSNLCTTPVYAQTLQKDAIIFDRICKPKYADMEKLYEKTQSRGIKISGFGPLTTIIAFIQSLGREKTEAKYITSGQILEDYSKVTGYCSISFL